MDTRTYGPLKSIFKPGKESFKKSLYTKARQFLYLTAVLGSYSIFPVTPSLCLKLPIAGTQERKSPTEPRLQERKKKEHKHRRAQHNQESTQESTPSSELELVHHKQETFFLYQGFLDKPYFLVRLFRSYKAGFTSESRGPQKDSNQNGIPHNSIG